MNVKEKVESLMEKHAAPGNDIDWIILSRLDFITLVFELFGHVTLSGIRIVSDESMEEGEVQVVDAKGIENIRLYGRR